LNVVFFASKLTLFLSCSVSDHRHTVDPSNVDVSIGSKGDSVYQPREESAASGGGPVSYSGGEGTGTNNTIPGGVKGTGGMGKRDGEDAMGGGGGVVGELCLLSLPLPSESLRQLG